MPSARTPKASGGMTATKAAERVGRAVAHVVNRLEALDADRRNAYEQLLSLQEVVNEQVTKFEELIRGRVGAASRRQPTPRRAPQPDATTTSKKAKKAQKARKATSRAAPGSTVATRKKRPAKKRAVVTCGTCGTRGHTARGHAKWERSKGTARGSS